MNPQRLDLSYCITWEGRWHIGSGYQSTVADKLLRRLGGANGDPFVPGSQIKGVLRYQCERLALAFGLDAVSPHAGIKEDEKALVTHFKPLTESTLVVDRLFGNRYQGECLFVTNATPILSEEAEETPITSAQPPKTVQPRTTLDRLTGTVMEQHLFTTEFSAGGARLQGDIRARHPVGVLTQNENGFPYEYALLLVSLLSSDILGGDKSTGLGRCRIDITAGTLLWNGKKISRDKTLESFNEEPAEWGLMLEMLREASTA